MTVVLLVTILAWIVSFAFKNFAITISLSIIIAAEMICLSLADLLRRKL